MGDRINAVYARQSLDKKDSISIESQAEICAYELRGGSCREYRDKGYSGKNTDRPDFQRLMRDIEAGLISKVVVYKLDRISRSILDFAGLMETFQKHGVEFVSSTEKFDTSTPMGRAMLNICIVFAQLERESIQQRVTDAWHSRCRKGFKMGGSAPYGFRAQPHVIHGVRTKRLVKQPEEAEFVRRVYEMYADRRMSLREIARELTAQGMKTSRGRPPSRATLSVILANPAYVIANRDVYEFFKSQGAEIVSGAEDFAGTNGCYYYQGKGIAGNKRADFQGHTLVVAPHEGFIPSGLWLRARKKLLDSRSCQPAGRVRNSWLAGKIKCGRCGYALMASHANGRIYLRCTVHVENKSCPGCGTVKMCELETHVHGEMVKKLRNFQKQTSRKKLAKQNELSRVQSEIETLIESLASAGAALSPYVNAKIEELDAQKQALIKEISALALDTLLPGQAEELSNQLNDWDNVSFEDKQRAADCLISRVRATSESVRVDWKI